MKNHRIALIAYPLMIIIWILLLILFSSEAFPSNRYIVQKGDTLSKIAQRHLGDWRKWKDLVEWNDLKVEWRKRIPYVLIKPGQRIEFESPWTREAIKKYRLATKHLLRKEMFRMIGVKIPTIDLKPKISLTVDLSCQYDVRVAQEELKSTLRDLANLERILIAHEIFDYSMQMPLHFFRGKPWIAHRKTAVLLMALMTTESHGRFLKGKHGERGIYQIKPETFRIVMGYKKKDLSEIEEVLMTSHYPAMKCVLKILQMGRTAHDGLKRYNAGVKDKARAYALRVMKVYYEIMERKRA